MEEYVGNSFEGIPVEDVTQDEQEGTAHAVALAENNVSERFLVLNGDIIFDESLVEVLGSAEGHVIATKEVANPSNYGVVSVENNELTGLIEKSSDPPTNLANLGLYAFEPSIFDAIETVGRSERGEYEIRAPSNISFPLGRPFESSNATAPGSTLDILGTYSMRPRYYSGNKASNSMVKWTMQRRLSVTL